jgi:hypothetical protein
MGTSFLLSKDDEFSVFIRRQLPTDELANPLPLWERADVLVPP